MFPCTRGVFTRTLAYMLHIQVTHTHSNKVRVGRQAHGVPISETHPPGLPTQQPALETAHCGLWHAGPVPGDSPGPDVRHSDWLCRGEGGWHSHPWQRRVALLRLLLLYMHYLLGRFTSWASVRFVCAQIRGTLASDALCCDSRSTVDPASYQIEYKG